MLALQKIRSSLERIANQAGIQATIFGATMENESLTALGKPETFLYISKDDLADRTRREIVPRMIRRHFR